MPIILTWLSTCVPHAPHCGGCQVWLKIRSSGCIERYYHGELKVKRKLSKGYWVLMRYWALCVMCWPRPSRMPRELEWRTYSLTPIAETHILSFGNAHRQSINKNWASIRKNIYWCRHIREWIIGLYYNPLERWQHKYPIVNPIQIQLDKKSQKIVITRLLMKD